jgi:glycine C-acetyltransferase
MSDTRMREHLRGQLEQLKKGGLYKRERLIESPQGPVIRVGGREVVNFCANNYLGLANHPEVIDAAHHGLGRWGFGLSSVRFICGTQELHKELEGTISRFFGKEDAILYTSCLDANGGLFETLLGEEDAVLSDELNHASIIDGVRLCKAQRFRYRHNDMEDLRRSLEAAQNARFRLIVTDSVFSMDGDLAKLPDICDLADQYSALVVIDDSHGTGHLGKSGRGAAEQFGVLDRIDIITSTLGKTLGGGSGGFTVGGAEVVDWLRNRSRPYLFSNSLTPSLVSAAMKALELIDRGSELRDRLASNTRQMRSGLEAAGFTLRPGPTPILPVMLGDAALATRMAERLLDHSIYVIGFSYPVVPQGQARIRLQVSAAHTTDQIGRAISAFSEVGRELRVIR